jgi:prolyl 4-hydroxylase
MDGFGAATLALATTAVVTLAVAIGVSVSASRSAALGVARAAPAVRLARVPSLPAGVTRATLSDSPVLDVLHNFVSVDEAAHLVALAAGRFERSFVVDPSTGQSVTNPKRTSTTVYLEFAEDGVVAEVEARAAAAVGVPVSHLERLQVVRYTPGQLYAAHHDYLTDSDDVLENGQRCVTMFVYLTALPPDDAGGATRFHKLGISVRPVLGSAALWFNMRTDAQGVPLAVDTRTLHSGEPTTAAEKYGLNIWFRTKPQKHRIYFDGAA